MFKKLRFSNSTKRKDIKNEIFRNLMSGINKLHYAHTHSLVKFIKRSGKFKAFMLHIESFN